MKGFFNPHNGRKLSARKLFSNKLFQRGGFSALALTIFASILITPRVASADLGDIIGNAIFEILIGAALGVLSVFISIAAIIASSIVYTVAWLSRYIVEFAINLSINFSYTSGPIFNAGWPVLRDLANMGLILILVGIGVGTMLNFKLNKNRLPMFFLVAILINLTPVITGVVIDFSNIVANVFFVSAKNALSAAIGNSPISYAVDQGQNMIQNATDSATNGNFSAAILGNIIQPILGVLIGLALIFVFLLLTALFLGRIVALLILVILSPIAFLGLIFQGGMGRQLWKKWWDTFFQWAFIVVPLIFFVWLGGIFLNAAPQLCDPQNSQFISLGVNEDLEQSAGFYPDPNAEANSASPADVFICRTASTFFALTSMVIGIMLSFKSSAAGAGIIIGKAQSVQRWGVKKARRAAGAPGRAAGRGVRRAAESPAARISQRLNDSKWATVPGIGAPIRGLAKAARQPIEQIQKEVQNYEKQFRQVKNFSQLRASLYAGGDQGFAAMRVAADKFADKFADEIEKSPELQKKFDVHRQRSKIRQDKMDRDILKRLPQLASPEERVQIAQGFKYNDLRDVSSKALEDGEFMNALLENENINYNAIHDTMTKDPERVGERMEAITKGFKEVRAIRDPYNQKTFEEVLDEIDKGKIKNYLKKSITDSPLLSAAMRTQRDAGVKEMQKDLEQDAERMIHEINEEQRKINEEIAQHQARINEEGLVVPEKMKNESREKIQELQNRKNTLSLKLKTYQSTAGKKPSSSKKKGGNRSTSNEDIANQLARVQNERSSITEKLREEGLENEERQELLDRQAALDMEFENLQNQQ